MKIIALQGKGGTGKSTTLKLFLKELLTNYYISATEYELYNLTQTGSISASNLDAEIKNENVSINNPSGVKNHTVICEINGKKIGLTTYGDTEWHIKQSLNCLLNCDIVICACRTKGKGYDYLYYNYKNSLMLTGKTYFWSEDKNITQYFIDYTNAKQVEILWEIFKKVI